MHFHQLFLEICYRTDKQITLAWATVCFFIKKQIDLLLWVCIVIRTLVSHLAAWQVFPYSLWSNLQNRHTAARILIVIMTNLHVYIKTTHACMLNDFKKIPEILHMSPLQQYKPCLMAPFVSGLFYFSTYPELNSFSHFFLFLFCTS